MEAQSSQLAFVEPVHITPLRILLDGRKLGDGGIGVYIDSTVRGLLERGGFDLTVIAKPGQCERASWKQEVSWLYDNARPYSLAEYLLLARRVDFTAYDLFHSPHYTLPFGIRIPTVVTIHDLIHIEHPERVYYPFIARNLIRSAVNRASAVIAVSEDTKRALAECIGASGDNISVIPNAIPDWMTRTEASEETRSVITDLSGDAPYFVAVLSNLKPHKGVEELLQGYASLRARMSIEKPSLACPQLLLVGHGAQTLKERYGSLSLQTLGDGVSIVGTVSSELLMGLYRRAHGLVVASRAEGFCIPALEAQSVGTRVICTPVPALLEFVANRDFVANDFSSGALAEVLFRAATTLPQTRAFDTSHLERFSRERISAQIGALYDRLVAAERVAKRGAV